MPRGCGYSPPTSWRATPSQTTPFWCRWAALSYCGRARALSPLASGIILRWCSTKSASSTARCTSLLMESKHLSPTTRISKPTRPLTTRISNSLLALCPRSTGSSSSSGHGQRIRRQNSLGCSTPTFAKQTTRYPRVAWPNSPLTRGRAMP